MKKIQIVTFILFSISSFGQQMRKLKITDSVVITSGLANSYFQEVFLKDTVLVAWFSHYVDSSLIRVEFIEKPGQTKIFSTRDLFLSSSVGSLSKQTNGYRMLRYYGKPITNFNFLENSIKSYPLVLNQQKEIIYPTRKAFFRNSAAEIGNSLFFNRHSIDYNNRSENKLNRSLKRHFKKQKVLLEYDYVTNKVLSVFGDYPQTYKESKLFYTNKEISFAADSLTNKLYLSFQGSHFIFQYDLASKKKDSIHAKGMRMTDSLMMEKYVKTEMFTNNDYYNLFKDSYDDIFTGNNKIFRVYKLHVNFQNLQGLIKSNNPKTCAAPSVIVSWNEFRLNKESFLQKIEMDNKSVTEFKFPQGMNCFIGYNEHDKTYYFRKNSIQYPKKIRDKIVVYLYKEILPTP